MSGDGVNTSVPGTARSRLMTEATGRGLTVAVQLKYFATVTSTMRCAGGMAAADVPVLNMNASICEAVQKRRVVSFVYKSGIRRVEPYCHGYAHQDEVLLGRQIGGVTSSGDLQRWRLFHIRRMEGLRVRQESFSPDDREYDRDDPHPAITEIHCMIESR
jgi:predicted DNA-binding transcriptional regulator YafY